MIIVAIIPLVDNIINASFGKDFGKDLAANYGFDSLFNFIWSLGASISPILLVLSSKMKPYLASYTVLIFTYSADIFWLLFSKSFTSTDYSYLYAFLFTTGFIITLYFLDKNIKNEISRNKFINEVFQSISKISNKKEEN